MPVKLAHTDIGDALRKSIQTSINTLPKRITLIKARNWLSILQWNATAVMYEETLRAMTKTGKKSRSLAISELAANLHITERQLYRRLQKKRLATD